MTEEELKDEICEYVHNLHKVEPFNGFTCRNLRDVAEHFALPREKRIAELKKENAELKKQLETVKEMCCGKVFCPYRSEISLSEVEK